MAPLQQSCPNKVLVIYVLFLFITSTFISASEQNHQPRRMLLELEDEDDAIIIKKKASSSSAATKNSTKLIKTGSNSSKNQTKLIKAATNAAAAFKNQTKLIKLTPDYSSNNKTKSKIKTSPSDSTVKETKSSSSSPPTVKTQFKKLNSTSKSSSSNSTTAKSSSLLTKKSSDLPKNKTNKPTTSKETKSQLEKGAAAQSKSKNPDKTQPTKSPKQPTSIYQQDDEDDDLVAGFRDLPSKFQENFMPDLDRISKTSKIYLTKYNKEFTKGFKPYVGNKYASTIASIVSFAFILIPLFLVSLIFSRIKAYFSLLKLLIFIQVYLAIYFTILCLSSFVTGLEPLKFFYSTSQSTYVCVQVLQTLCYVLYLLLLLMYLVLVFSTDTGLATKMLGLGQTFVGFAVGLHYYMTVFHRAVLHQPPKTSWKVHAMYATCFVVICMLGRIDRRKKAYLVEGVEEGKKS